MLEWFELLLQFMDTGLEAERSQLTKVLTVA